MPSCGPRRDGRPRVTPGDADLIAAAPAPLRWRSATASGHGSWAGAARADPRNDANGRGAPGGRPRARRRSRGRPSGASSNRQLKLMAPVVEQEPQRVRWSRIVTWSTRGPGDAATSRRGRDLGARPAAVPALHRRPLQARSLSAGSDRQVRPRYARPPHRVPPPARAARRPDGAPGFGRVPPSGRGPSRGRHSPGGRSIRTIMAACSARRRAIHGPIRPRRGRLLLPARWGRTTSTPDGVDVTRTRRARAERRTV